jgi:hypothetical protein
MSDFKIISIEPKSNDLLLITAQVGVETVRVGTDDDGETPSEMTEDEKRAYAERVVREQHPDVFEGV